MNKVTWPKRGLTAPQAEGHSHPQLLVDEVHELCVRPTQEDNVSYVVCGQLAFVDVVHFAHIMGS